MDWSDWRAGPCELDAPRLLGGEEEGHLPAGLRHLDEVDQHMELRNGTGGRVCGVGRQIKVSDLGFVECSISWQAEAELQKFFTNHEALWTKHGGLVLCKKKIRIIKC